MMRTRLYGVTAAAFSLLIGCAADGPIDEFTEPSSSAPRNALADSAQTEQIDTEAKPFAQESLQVEQITSKDRSREYTFADLEGDDPCLIEANRELAQCKSTSIERQVESNTARARNNNRALSELQAITPNVIDPSTFDADRAADEIGRSGRSPQSQIGMAVGAEFLAPPPPPPEPEVPDIDAFGRNGIPPNGGIGGNGS